MKIGFDISQTGQSKAGCGYFADSLVRSLVDIDRADEYILYPTFGDLYWDNDWPNAVVRLQQANVQRGLGHKSFEVNQAFWREPTAAFEAQLGHPAIVHANNFFCPTGLQQARLVYTLYDLGFLAHPEWTTEANRLGCFDGVFQASLHADHIIAISHYSRDHFLSTFPHYPAERITVIHPASRFTDRALVAQPKSLAQLQPGQFWLSVGTIEPRKNHRALLRAYARLKREQGTVMPLAFAGGAGWLMEDFQRLVEQLELQHDVIMLGYVDNAALQWLYQQCFALVYPSLFEGFGLPVLEAMSLGAAVITSNSTSIPEITGDAAILVDPLQEDSIAAGLLTLATDQQLRLDLKQRALARSQLFSWQRAAQQLVQIYHTLA